MKKLIHNIEVGIKNIVRFLWYRVLGRIFWIFPIKKNRVVCQSFFGKGYGDNPKYIVEEILAAKEDFELIWLIKSISDGSFPKEVTIVKRGTIKELFYLSTAKFWIDNSRKPYGLKKRKKQYYIQTWHGAMGLKQAERDVVNILPWYYIKSAKNDSQMIDLLMSGSEWNTNYFRKNFWYDGEIAEIGLPRTDVFFANRNNKEKYLDLLKLDRNVRYILYAPTFRHEKKMEEIMPNIQRLLQVFREKFGGEWKLLLRFHPNVAEDYRTKIWGESIIQASFYPDINELIFAADFFMTDYSSCMFDAMFAEVPVVLYMSDFADYSKNRGIAMDMEMIPFLKTYDGEELLDSIKMFNLKHYTENIIKFQEEIKIYDNGTASKKILKKMVSIRDEK